MFNGFKLTDMLWLIYMKVWLNYYSLGTRTDYTKNLTRIKKYFHNI